MNGGPEDPESDVARRGRTGHRHRASSSSERSSSYESRSRRRKGKKKRKRAKEKRSRSRYKHKRRSHSSQESSQSDDASSSDRRHHRHKRKKKKKSRRSKNDDCSVDVADEAKSKDATEFRKGKADHSEGSSAGGDSRASVAAIAGAPKPEAPKPVNKPKGPMTQAEYQELQSQLREVYDPQSGRTRLVRGTGEIVERIVGSSQHANLNRTGTCKFGIAVFLQKDFVFANTLCFLATYGDGSSYARDIMRAAGARKMG